MASEQQRELEDFWLGTYREARGKGKCENKTLSIGLTIPTGVSQTCWSLGQDRWLNF